MKYQTGDFEAVHRSPVWRERSNFVVAALLGTKDGKREWEQLWVQQLAAQRFIICCIPFFTYDISLGDEVETDEDLVVQRVVRRSGQVTFRVWFESVRTDDRQHVVRQSEAMGALMEWSSENLLALSISDDKAAQRLADLLQVGENEGLLRYESGRTQA